MSAKSIYDNIKLDEDCKEIKIVYRESVTSNDSNVRSNDIIGYFYENNKRMAKRY
jgi:hypothetical protein